MFVHKTLSIGLVVLRSILGVSCSYDPYPCTKPAVRKEWRSFSTEEKAEWIRAVNVRVDTIIILFVPLKQCWESSACHNNLMTWL